MKILGIDPGTATTGFGVLECDEKNVCSLASGWIETSKDDEAGTRLVKIFDELTAIIEKHQPDVMAVERLFFFANHKTAMAVSESIGIIKMAAEKKNLPVVSFSPPDVKLTVTGSGRADKKEVKASVRKILNVRSPNKKKTHFDDLADALAVAICYARKNVLVSEQIQPEKKKVVKKSKK